MTPRTTQESVAKLNRRKMTTTAPAIPLPDDLSTRAFGLRFADDDFERAYGEQRAANMPSHLRPLIILGTAFWISFAIFDVLADPMQPYPRFFPYRAASTAAMALAGSSLFLERIHRRYWQYVVLFCLACPIVAIIAVVPAFGAETTLISFGSHGITITLFMALTGFSLDFRPAALLAWSLWAAYGVTVAIVVAPIDVALAFSSVFFPSATCALGSYVVYQLDTGRRQRFGAELTTAWERYWSDGLLTNVLPSGIASQLRGSPDRIAKSHAGVTVIFADIVGFTKLSETLPPEALIDMLSDVFLAFDAAAERCGVEKIKTIGDAYMAVAGAPEERADHAPAAARFALELRRLVDDLEPVDGHKLQIRIGMDSGPVYAGVLGSKRLIYDLWGDTVNAASRMESHGIAGRIQVTDTTAELLTGFALQKRGPIEIKGKGTLETWFLTGPTES